MKHNFWLNGFVKNKIAAFWEKVIHSKNKYLPKREWKDGNYQWRTVSGHDDWLLVASIGWHGPGQYVVLTRRCNASHIGHYIWVVARKVPWMRYFQKWWCEMAAKIVRYNALKRFFKGGTLSRWFMATTQK